MSIERDRKFCPACGDRGKRVKALTLRSQLSEEAKSRLGSDEGFLFCRTGDCDVSYFGHEIFLTSDVRVAIFQKSTDPQRLVCYCFRHSVAEIVQEVEQTGSSAVLDAIRESCKKGLDECEKNNPQGSCCLGNVSRVIRDAQTKRVSSDSGCADDSCCASTDENA